MHGRRKFWGWGLEAEVLRAEEVSALEVAYARRFGIVDYDVTPAPRAEEIGLRAPRVTPPESLRDVCTTEHYERLLHSYGQSFFDSARIFARDFANPPDVVALPARRARYRRRSRLVRFSQRRGHSLGRRFERGRRRRAAARRPPGASRIDLQHLGQVLEIDATSQAARIQGGTYGPALESQLKPQRPHAAALPAVLRVLHAGRLDRHPLRRPLRHALHPYRRFRRKPARGDAGRHAGIASACRAPAPGPAPTGMFIGSEGIARHHHRSLDAAAAAAELPRRRPRRASRISTRRPSACAPSRQAHLYPANCRLLDADEALSNRRRRRQASRSWCSPSSPPTDRRRRGMQRALEIVRDHGGEYDEARAKTDDAQREGAAGHWRDSLHPHALLPRGPDAARHHHRHLRDRDHLGPLPRLPRQGQGRRPSRRSRKSPAGKALVTCRFTHVYPGRAGALFLASTRSATRRAWSSSAGRSRSPPPTR